MTFGDAVISAFTKYADFSGRARRAEFWYFHLFNCIVTVCLSFILNLLPFSSAFSLIGLYSLAVFVPELSVTWRRLQDTGRSGFLFFLTFIPLVGGILVFIWLCCEGQHGPNRFGPDPKQSSFTQERAPWEN